MKKTQKLWNTGAGIYKSWCDEKSKKDKNIKKRQISNKKISLNEQKCVEGKIANYTVEKFACV